MSIREMKLAPRSVVFDARNGRMQAVGTSGTPPMDVKTSIGDHVVLRQDGNMADELGQLFPNLSSDAVRSLGDPRLQRFIAEKQEVHENLVYERSETLGPAFEELDSKDAQGWRHSAFFSDEGSGVRQVVSLDVTYGGEKLLHIATKRVPESEAHIAHAEPEVWYCADYRLFQATGEKEWRADLFQERVGFAPPASGGYLLVDGNKYIPQRNDVELEIP